MTFKKGQSGNPAGRPPKGLTVADLFAAEGDREIAGKKTTQRQELIHKIYQNAIDGDPAFARLCLEREYGKALEEIAISDSRKKPLDLSKLNDKELAAFMALLNKAEPDDADIPEQG